MTRRRGPLQRPARLTAARTAQVRLDERQSAAVAAVERDLIAREQLASPNESHTLRVILDLGLDTYWKENPPDA